LNAFGGQCGAALRAEAPTLWIIRVTAQAFHEAVQLLIAVDALPISGTGPKSSVDQFRPRSGTLRLLLVFIF
jgi:hypothetical protein